ncbi:hypothetical protein ACC785_37785, partial [Rhizobium ruizarguesonis]
GLDLGHVEQVVDEAVEAFGFVDDGREQIESGAMEPNSALHYAGDIVGSALRRAAKILDNHKAEMSIPADLPMVRVDPVLFEQV